jgi:hypothetical protein
MKFLHNLPSDLLSLLLLATALPARAVADNILQTTGFDNCGNDTASISVQSLTLTFDDANKLVTFDVAAMSTVIQNVTASLEVYAYGKLVYSKELDPCSSATYIQQLCPVPTGNFSARGEYVIPAEYASVIPAVAYAIPNLDGNAKLTLNSQDGSERIACVETSVSNGKTTNTPAASYAAVGIAGASLAITAVSAIAGVGSAAGLAFGHAPGAGAMSPSFFDVVGWMQTMAFNGMLSVNYPSVYRSFTQNFGFTSGIVSWDVMQNAIDSFRASTGGNLTGNSYEYLKSSTVVYQSDLSSNVKRDLGSTFIRHFVARDIIANINGTSTSILGGTTNYTGATAQ